MIKKSKSYSDCVRELGYSTNGRYPRDLIKARCQELGISTEHFTKTGGGLRIPKDLEDILVEDSSYKNMGRLKTRLIRNGLIEYKCAICGNIGEWMGKELVLQIDHINGVHTDNRLENLRLLCPNCHSQTDTFGTRKSRAK